MSAAPAPPSGGARFTSQGFEACESWMRGRMGKNWSKLKKSLTVRAVPDPRAPPAALRNLRKHVCYMWDAPSDRITFPRRFAEVFAQNDTANILFSPFEKAHRLIEPEGNFGGAPSGVRSLDLTPADFKYTLYPYQSLYVEYVVQHRLCPQKLRAGAGQVYIHLDTGQGKTIVGLALVARLRVPTCVVVPTLELQDTGVKRAMEALPKLRVVAYSNALARKHEKKGKPALNAANVDVMFIVINTARTKPPEFYHGFGMIILDEASEYHSPTSSAILWNAQAPCLVGLSATPHERTDKMDRVVSMFLGNPLSLEEVIPSDVIDKFQFRGRVREVKYVGHPNHLGEAVPGAAAIVKIGNIVADPHRLECVAAEVDQLLHLHETLPPEELEEWGLGLDEHGVVRRHAVFVFAEHRDYLPALRAALNRRGITGDKIYIDEDDPTAVPDATILRGGATEVDRYDSLRSSVVLTTYGFSRRGISLNQMTAQVLASPRRNGLTQISGRICRLTPDPSTRSICRVVVDIRDVKTSLASQSSTRRTVYRNRLWDIYSVDSAFTDFPLDAAAPAPAGEYTVAPAGAPLSQAKPPSQEKRVVLRARKQGAAEADAADEEPPLTFADVGL
jgi:hypothetical protein